MAKRLGLVLAREKKNLSKKDIAIGSSIEYQRYKRIETDANVKVDIEEAYRIANFLGYNHPGEIFLKASVENLNKPESPKSQAS